MTTFPRNSATPAPPYHNTIPHPDLTCPATRDHLGKNEKDFKNRLRQGGFHLLPQKSYQPHFHRLPLPRCYIHSSLKAGGPMSRTGVKHHFSLVRRKRSFLIDSAWDEKKYELCLDTKQKLIILWGRTPLSLTRGFKL